MTALQFVNRTLELRLAFGVPASTLLSDLLFLLEPRQDAVQVVLLDAHLGGELGNRDARLTLHERQRLERRACRCLYAFRARPLPGRRLFGAGFGGRGFAGGFFGATEPRGLPGPRGGRSGRGDSGRTSATPCKRGCGRLEAGVLIDEGFSSFSRSVISCRFSSRKSVTVTSSSLVKCALNQCFSSRGAPYTSSS